MKARKQSTKKESPMEEIHLELTTEQKNRISSCMGFTVDTPFPYVPKAFRAVDSDSGEPYLPKEAWPIFTLRSKDGLEIAELEDSAGYMTYDQKKDDARLRFESGTVRIQTLCKGIIRVKNYRMENDDIVDYDAKTCDMVIRHPDGKSKVRNNVDIRKFVKLMKADFQKEIQNAINERTTLTEEEARGLEL